MLDLTLFIHAGIGLVTAVVAAYLSAQWAMRRAFQERWWDRKERAYAEIVDALYDLIRYSDLRAQEYLDGREHPKIKELRERYDEARWRLEKTTDIGAFVICEQAARILDDLRKRPRLDWQKDCPSDIYEQDCVSYKDALKQLIVCAKKDLKV